MKKFLSALSILILAMGSCAPLAAQTHVVPVYSYPSAGTPPSVILQCDVNGDNCGPTSAANPLQTSGGGGGGSNAAAVAQASTTAGQFGSFTQAATLASAPTYTAGTTNPIWTNTSGALATFFPSTPTINIGTAPSIAVTGTFWQATQPISAAALPLPSGAASETTLANFSATTHADLIAATPSGTNLIGKVGIDQTTPGTTNAVFSTNWPTTISVNTGATGASSPRFTVAVDSATVAGSVTLPAGSNIIGNVRIDQTTPGTTNGVVATGNVASGAADNGNPAKVGGVFNSSPPTVTTGQRVDLQLSAKGRLIPEVTQTSGVDGQANANLGGFPAGGLSAVPMLTISSVFNSSTWDRWRSIQGADGTGIGIAGVAISPNSNANAALAAVVSTTLEGCHVLKASAGNLYSLSATIQATTVVIQVFNATSAPADGAVTPIWSMPVISNGTLGGDSWNFSIPLRGSTGLTVCASSATTPFTKTASATAMFSGQVQ